VHTRQYPEDELKQLFLKDDSGFWPGRNEMRSIRIYGANNEVQSGIVKERADFEYDEEWLKRRQELEQEAG
jgi:hypothetical protein